MTHVAQLLAILDVDRLSVPSPHPPTYTVDCSPLLGVHLQIEVKTLRERLHRYERPGVAVLAEVQAQDRDMATRALAGVLVLDPHLQWIRSWVGVRDFLEAETRIFRQQPDLGLGL